MNIRLTAVITKMRLRFGRTFLDVWDDPTKAWDINGAVWDNVSVQDSPNMRLHSS